MNDTTRKAITDAVLDVQDFAKANGRRAARGRDWPCITVPRSVPGEETMAYCEAYTLTASLTADLVASLD